MNTPAVSVDRLSQLEQARTAIMHGGQAHSPWVADWISQSWHRCLSQGMQPHYQVGFDPVSGAHIKRTLEQHHELVQSARPELERLGRAIAGTSFFPLIHIWIAIRETAIMEYIQYILKPGFFLESLFGVVIINMRN